MNRNDIKAKIFSAWFDDKPPAHVAVTLPVMLRVIDDPEIRNYPEGIITIPRDSGIMRFLFPRNVPNPDFLALALEKTGYSESELLAFTSVVEADAHYINAPGIENIPFTWG